MENSVADSDVTKMNLVLIDDDAMVLRSLKTALTDFGFTVSTFEEPLKGLEWIEENGADIVISDIRMPSCDGFEVLKRLKEIDPQCDLIFITAHGQMETAIRALREGATDFFEKPFTTFVLRAAIERTRRFRMLSQQKKVLADQLNLLNNELLYRNSSHYIMLGQSAGMKNIAKEIVDIANSNATVLIIGESGTGKELVAHAVHQSSPRSKQPFLTINCASIPEDLFESEMFGHRRGSFTGAVETRGGYIEAASGGTLFLDEIGDLPLPAQSKILRLLEQKSYLPIGEHKERTADVRIIAATNQALDCLVKEKKFREDLYYRLTVCNINLPPLRDRKEDIPLLALFFVLQFASEMGKSIEGIDPEAMRILISRDYPGNIRELRNIVESSVIRCRHTGLLRKEDLSEQPSVIKNNGESAKNAWPMETLRLEDVERRLYLEALNRTNNNVSAAARLLGLSRGKFRRRLASLNITADEA
ncbi:MAG: sigma-54 dependent transcriptional regulator [Kiritimatiellae bacterium]|nr:sigma-54 dependent transcriptional regulator [Kiritimatiellia bacterium]MDD5522285.1 sigma-54 dependent transcriptional regulator [Kiritimatiellia bacterium]